MVDLLLGLGLGFVMGLLMQWEPQPGGALDKLFWKISDLWDRLFK